MAKYINLSQLLADYPAIEVVQGKKYVAQRKISVSDVYRPAIELTGYFDFYPQLRVQLLGRTEISYAARLDPDSRRKVFSRMCQPRTPCFLVARSLPVPEELRAAAAKEKIPILSSDESTTYISGILTQYLRVHLAPRLSIHGVLVEIRGMGVLLTGKSGIGKSETALALVHRGHRLIADDRVDVYQRDHHTVVGEAPKILKHLMEIRGIGIINVMTLYGAGAVKNSNAIDLVIHLVNWNKNDNYDRLGFNEAKREICGVELPEITIPVKVGRNLEIIVEVAAMNFRAKQMGYDASRSFDQNLTKLIAKHSEDEDD